MYYDHGCKFLLSYLGRNRKISKLILIWFDTNEFDVCTHTGGQTMIKGVHISYNNY